MEFRNNERPVPAVAEDGPLKSDRLGSAISFLDSLSSPFSQYLELDEATKHALQYPTDMELRWLFNQDVPDTAMLEPTHLRAGTVTFLGEFSFDFDPDGERALIFFEPADLVAWQPRSGKLGAWRNNAFALNEDAIWNPASYFSGSALRVHHTPLEWLVANRDGIVIVQPRFTYANLKDCRRLSFSDHVHAQRVKQWLQPPKPTVEILIEDEERRSA
jgi:hypothetical protein